MDPGTSTSGLSSDVTVGGAGSSLVQITGDPVVLTATQPVQAPSTRGPVTASKSATSPVEGPGTSVVSQQNVTQPVEAPGAGPEALLMVMLPYILRLLGQIVRRNSRVNPAILLMATSGTGPQSSPEKNQLRSLVTGRLSQV